MMYALKQQEASFDLVPHSFVFCARWFQDKWILGGQSIVIANDVKFGSDAALFDEFVRLYGQENVDALDKNVIHVFRLSSNKYMPIDCKEGVQLIETRESIHGQLLNQNVFQNKNTFNPEDFRAYLVSLTEKVQNAAVAARYKEEDVLTVSVVLSMGPYLVQMDSGIQRITEQCVMQKKYMRSYMQESDHPLAIQIRQVAALKAEEAEQARKLGEERKRAEEELARQQEQLAQNDEQVDQIALVIEEAVDVLVNKAIDLAVDFI